MSKLLFILGASIGSIATGYLVQVVLTRRDVVTREMLLAISRIMKLAAFFFIQPVAMIGTFWGMSLGAVEVLAFPPLGFLSVLASGGIALLVLKLTNLPPKRAASVFTSGMFTNVLTIGGFVGFVFFDEPGYLLAQLYTTFIGASYYLVGYPVSRNIGAGADRVLRLEIRALREHPVLFIPIAAMATGLILNLTGVGRPAVMDPLINIIVPSVSILLGASIGLSLRFSKVRNYRKEIGIVLLMKFLISPLLMIPVGLLLGLQRMGDGTPFKMLVVLSVMPVAFNALVPPALYGFDLDLANSAWLVTTGSLVVIVPVLYFVLV